MKPGTVGSLTGRVVMFPARVVARTPLGASARRRLQSLPGDVLGTPEAERAIDGVLAGPLPEAVARSLVEHRVVERVVHEMLASADLDRAIASALESEQAEELVARAPASPALERRLGEVLESRLTLELTDRLVRSPEFERVLSRVLSGPEVRAALTQQTTSLAGEMASGLRRRAIKLDVAVEAGPRRWLHRSERTPSFPYAGVATRGIAITIDAVLAQLIFVVGSALIGLVASLFGTLRPAWLVAALLGSGWALVVGIYFVTFWTVAGQTPGMRAMRLRLLDGLGFPPTPPRAVLRLVALAVSVLVVFLGFLPALVDNRRRAVHDVLAGTVVAYDQELAVPGGALNL